MADGPGGMKEGGMKDGGRHGEIDSEEEAKGDAERGGLSVHLHLSQ